jgi:hypothetical protein
LYLVQRILLLLVRAVLGQLTDQTALRLGRPLLAVVQAVTVNHLLARVVLPADQAAVAVTPTKAAALALAVKAIPAVQVRLSQVAVVVRVLLVVRQMAAQEQQIALLVLL